MDIRVPKFRITKKGIKKFLQIILILILAGSLLLAPTLTILTLL